MFFSPFLIATTEEQKYGLKVDLYYLIKAAGFMLATLLLYSKMGKFEILVVLLAKAQSQQVIWRIMLDGC